MPYITVGKENSAPVEHTWPAPSRAQTPNQAADGQARSPGTEQAGSAADHGGTNQPDLGATMGQRRTASTYTRTAATCALGSAGIGDRPGAPPSRACDRIAGYLLFRSRRRCRLAGFQLVRG